MFGKKKQDEAPTTQKAIQKLRSTEELLQKRSDFLEKKIQNEVNVAKQNASKNKRAALNALKRKKRLEKQLNQIDGNLSTIEFQREALEGANTNTEVLKNRDRRRMGLRRRASLFLKNMSYAAKKALKSAHRQKLDVDDHVNDMKDDIQEQTELADEISRAISEPVGFGQDIDEDELNAELEELEQEGLDEVLLEVGGTADLPTVPATELPAQPARAKAKKTEDDDILAELEAWAS